MPPRDSIEPRPGRSRPQTALRLWGDLAGAFPAERPGHDPNPALYDRAFHRAGALLSDCWLRLESERLAAIGQIARLLKLPAGRRGMLVRNSAGMRTWGVLERLVGTARQALAENPADPAAAEELTTLALELVPSIACDLYPRVHRMDLEARAWGVRSRCREMQGDLAGAEAALAISYRRLLEGSRDGWERAVWLEGKAAVRRAQGRWHEAEAALRRATAIFREIGDDRQAGRCLAEMVELHRRFGSSKSATQYAGQAVALHRGAEPELLAKALVVQVESLAAAGSWFEAQRALCELSSLVRRHPRLPIALPELRRRASPPPAPC